MGNPIVAEVNETVNELNETFRDFCQDSSLEELEYHKSNGYLLYFYLMDANNTLNIFGCQEATTDVDLQTGNSFILNNAQIDPDSQIIKGGLVKIPYNPITEQFEITGRSVERYQTFHHSPEEFLQFVRSASYFQNGSAKFVKIPTQNPTQMALIPVSL